MGPSINEALQLAEQKFAKRDFPGAKIILEEIVSSVPTCSRANELLAYILWNEGNPQRGLECLKKAVSAPDCSPIALYEIAVIYTDQGNYSEAIPLFEKSLERSGGFFELYHEYGRALASNGNYQKSLAIFLKAEARFSRLKFSITRKNNPKPNEYFAFLLVLRSRFLYSCTCERCRNCES